MFEYFWSACVIFLVVSFIVWRSKVRAYEKWQSAIGRARQAADDRGAYNVEDPDDYYPAYSRLSVLSNSL